MLEISDDDVLDALEETHMHIIGSSGSGKSKFIEWLIQRLTDSVKPTGFCVIDWHGTLYDAVLGYLAGTRFSGKVYLMDPSRGDFVTGYNPFLGYSGDLSTAVSQRVDLTVKPWGAESTNETPTIAQMLRRLYTFAAEANETLPNAYLLFGEKNENIRQFAADIVRDPYMRHELRDFVGWKPSEIESEVGSSKRRLDRFLALVPIRRIIGRQSGNISIRQILAEDAVLLVNLAGSPNFSAESARLLATLLLNDFRESALERAGTDQHFFLFLDEFQEYITPDIAASLNEVRKGGLHLGLSHQTIAQLVDDEKLAGSIQTNARIKAVFGGLSYVDAAAMAMEIRTKNINLRQIVNRISATTTVGHEMKVVTNDTYSRSISNHEESSHADGGVIYDAQNSWDKPTESHAHNYNDVAGGGRNETEAFGSVENHMLMPIVRKELRSEEPKSTQEKINAEAYEIMTLARREVFLKLPGMDQAAFMEVPMLSDWNPGKEGVEDFRLAVFNDTGSLPAAEVDQELIQSEARFFARVKAHEEEKIKQEKAEEEARHLAAQPQQGAQPRRGRPRQKK